MDEKKRLGPQDLLSWIRDTREERLENPEYTQRPVVREIVHTDKTIPMEVKVILKGQPVKQTQTITLEITVGQK